MPAVRDALIGTSKLPPNGRDWLAIPRRCHEGKLACCHLSFSSPHIFLTGWRHVLLPMIDRRLCIPSNNVYLFISETRG